jgi:hypothetical protein
VNWVLVCIRFECLLFLIENMFLRFSGLCEGGNLSLQSPSGRDDPIVETHVFVSTKEVTIKIPNECKPVWSSFLELETFRAEKLLLVSSSRPPNIFYTEQSRPSHQHLQN